MSRPREMRWDERLAARGGQVEWLRVPAALFAGAVHARRWAYDCGLAPARKAGLPVLSVGNLSAGGTGKTPVCIWLARELERRGYRVGLLSRGYHADEQGLNDEARMFAAACPQVVQVQDRQRVRGARALLDQGVQVILLDDGFQHRALARSQDWVLIDATRPWGLPRDPHSGASVRALLPRGLLREPLSSLRRADAILITRTDQVPAAWLEELEAELERAAPGAARMRCVHRAQRLLDERGQDLGLESLRGASVRLLSGIGNPQAFERSVQALGATILEHRRFPDHHAYTRAELESLTGQQPWLVTEKDAVKLLPLGFPCWRLGVDLAFLSGENVARALLDTLMGAQA